MWDSDVDFDLAAFHALVRALKRTLRQLVESALAHVLLQVPPGGPRGGWMVTTPTGAPFARSIRGVPKSSHLLNGSNSAIATII